MITQKQVTIWNARNALIMKKNSLSYPSLIFSKSLRYFAIFYLSFTILSILASLSILNPLYIYPNYPTFTIY